MTSEQSSSRAAISKEWLEMIENDPNIFKRVIVYDGKLVAPFWTNTQAEKYHMEDHNLTKKEKSLAKAVS